MRAGESALFQRMLGENAFYVLQNEMPELDLLAAMEAQDEEGVRDALDRIARAFDMAPGRGDFRSFITTRMRVFFAADDWIGCARTVSLAVGSRFHGNIAALLAGTPALFLVHDMRTAELCDLLRVPSLALDRPFGADEIVERMLAVDYGPFLAQVPRLMMEWRLFLARNGLSTDQGMAESAANAGLAPALTA
jgi:polysaccharide pyruvyl transferase WcaK-like protein